MSKKRMKKEDRLKVKCLKCGHEHYQHEMKLDKATRSYVCPKCGHGSYEAL